MAGKNHTRKNQFRYHLIALAMANKLSSILPQYRHYQADQVLTHTQLNETIAYFEDQDRLTRIGLIGVGIVNGFGLSTEVREGGRWINIQQGYGITTDGDLITLQQSLEDEESKEKDIRFDALSFSHYRPFEDDKANYPFFQDEGAQITLLELCQQGEDDALPLSGLADLNDKVVLLYLESYPKDQDICGDINCDNQGIEQVARTRYLLIDQSAIPLVIAGDTIFQRFEHIRSILAEIQYLHPFKVVISDTNAQTTVQLDRLYRDAILQGNTLGDFSNGLKAVLDGFSFLFENDGDIQQLSANLDQLLGQHFSFPQNGPYQYNQYRYSLLKDVLGEYRALIGEVLIYSSLENPDINAFPKHLMLGSLGEATYRHGFYASPAISNHRDKVERIRQRLAKIYFMLSGFDLTQGNEVRIIPSGEKLKDGTVGSIPFYYRNTTGLLQNWSAVLRAIPITYQYALGNNPLLSENGSQDFYYLGGHLGSNAENTFDTLLNMQRQFGLDFSLYRFDLQQPAAYRSFLQQHASCTHLAGVPRSGTLILLSNGNQVIGDLALYYRVTEAARGDATCHIKVAESRYPWISTLTYLNNLSRSLRGTPRRMGVTPRHYRLVVREYQINGVSQVSGATELLIPLEDILLRRMHAITEALNRRFPNGLVFDFNEQLKRFVIIRAYDDEFRITFADTTLSLNAPAFTYTQNNMFRADRLFRLDAIRVEERRRYRESTYRQLQQEFAPAAHKDDDYGRYQGRWAEWYRLIDTLSRSTNSLVTPRFITNQNQLPVSVRNIINSVRSALTATGRPFELYLTGDWLDGSWVSIEMLNRYGNSNNTNDVIVRFLRLRESLHHKTQATKASLFLVLGREMDREVLQRAAANHTDRVDIYIDGPRVGGRTLIVDGLQRLRIP